MRARGTRRARLDGATLGRVGRLGLAVVEIEREFAAIWTHDLDAALPDVTLDKDDPASILYTSGTTGPAKGVVSTHRNVIALCMVQLFHAPRLRGASAPDDRGALRDADGRAVRDGVEGEIHVRGPLVMKEYWRKPDATAASILPGRWLRTGDIGRIEDGLLYIHSRRRDMILGYVITNGLTNHRRERRHPDGHGGAARAPSRIPATHPDRAHAAARGGRRGPAALARGVDRRADRAHSVKGP